MIAKYFTMRLNRFSVFFLRITLSALRFFSLKSLISSWRWVITAESFMAIFSFMSITWWKRAEGTPFKIYAAEYDNLWRYLWVDEQNGLVFYQECSS